MDLSNPSNEISLSDRCCICYATPKYKCPRCSARTCSVPCIKQHKSRALCSGERNPAVFKKRSQVATPEVFDLDFNFLSGLEKRMGDARRQTQQTQRELPPGPALAAKANKDRDQRSKEVKDAAKERSKLLEMAEQRGVIFRGAPEGMSMRVQNLTKWNKSKGQIEWMIEWQFLNSKHRSVVSEEVSLSRSHDTKVFELLDDRDVLRITQQQKDYTRDAGVQFPVAIYQHKGLNRELGDLTANGDKRVFYLHLPEFSTGLKQAIMPVDGKIRLRDILANHVIWEFPKIIVAVPGVDDLDPEGYVIKPSTYTPALDLRSKEDKSRDKTKKRKRRELEGESIRGKT